MLAMKTPFKYGCVVGGDNFCERPELERKLAGFVRSGQNVVMQGEAKACIRACFSLTPRFPA